MKKTIVILMIQLIAVLGISAEAASIRRRDFAAAVAPYLADYEPQYVEMFVDVTETTINAGAICLLGEYGILNCSNNKFSPTAYMKNDEVSAALAKIFTIRCGQLKQYNSGTSIDNYFDIRKEYREYVNLASSLGLVAYNEGNYRVPMSRYMNDTELDKVLAILDKNIDTFLRITNENMICTVTKDGNLRSGVIENETIDYFMTINDTSYFASNNVYVSFAKYKDGVLKDVTLKKYTDIKSSDFYILHESFDTGEICDELCVYLWDADTMSPISDKITMQFN